MTLYTGNDPYDCFTSVYGAGQLAHLRGEDANLITSELREDLEQRIAQAFTLIGGPRPAGSGSRARGGVRGWLSNHSRRYGVARAARRVGRGQQAPSWEARCRKAERSDGALVPFEAGGGRSPPCSRSRSGSGSTAPSCSCC